MGFAIVFFNGDNRPWPRCPESNRDQSLRSARFYPLNYSELTGNEMGNIGHSSWAMTLLQQQSGLLGIFCAHAILEFASVGCAYGGFKQFHISI